MRISDWSSDVCSSDLHLFHQRPRHDHLPGKGLFDGPLLGNARGQRGVDAAHCPDRHPHFHRAQASGREGDSGDALMQPLSPFASSEVEMPIRSEEHTSELQSLMRISYAVFCLKKKKQTEKQLPTDTETVQE